MFSIPVFAPFIAGKFVSDTKANRAEGKRQARRESSPAVI
jgi:hypothetical protein